MKIKRKYEIVRERNKRLLISIEKNEITQSQLRIKRRDRARKTFENVFEFRQFSFDFSFDVETFFVKRIRSFLVIKSINLSLYHDKFFKKHQN